MNIIIDLDNTLFYNHVVDTVSALHSIPRGNRHDLNDMPEHIKQICFNQFKDPNIMGNLQPFVGVYDVVQTLINMGHKVYIVTARDDSLKDVTIAMVEKHLPVGVEVILVGSYNKHAIYTELKADMVIDDHFHHIQEAKVARVPHVVMISNNLTPYNHEYRDCVLNIGGTIVNSISTFGSIFVQWQDYMDRIEYCNDVNDIFNQYYYECSEDINE